MTESLEVKVIWNGQNFDTGVKQSITQVSSLVSELNKAGLALDSFGRSAKTGLILPKDLLRPVQDIPRQVDPSGRLPQTTRESSALAMAMLNLNYVVRDSPYFFQSFAMGILAIGNNLNPLIDTMRRASEEAKVMNTTLGAQMLNFLKGPGGITFAFSLLVTALQAVTFAMSRSTKETKDQVDNFARLKKAVDDLKASFDDLWEAENRRKADTSDIIFSKQEEANDLKAKIDLGGFKSQKDGFVPYTKEQMESMTNQLKALTDRIAFLQAEGNKDIIPDKTVSLMKGLAEASKTGAKGLQEFAVANKLSSEQLGGLLDRLREADKNFYSVGGQIRQGISQEGILTVGKLRNAGLTQPVLESTAKELANYTDSLDQATRKDSKKKTQDFEAEKMELEFQWGKIGVDQYRNFLQQRIDSLRNASGEQLKILYGFKEKALAVDKEYFGLDNVQGGARPADFGGVTALGLEGVPKVKGGVTKYKGLSDLIPTELAPEKSGKGDMNDPLKVTKDAKQEMSFLMNVSHMLGNSLFNAFKKGGEGVVGFISSVGEAIMQMLVLDAVTSLLTGQSTGIVKFLGFQNGGVVPRAANGYVVPGNSYYGDRVPIMANSGEMILNGTQQSNLFKMINNANFGNLGQTVLQPTFIFENTIDSQEIVLKGIKKLQRRFR